MTIKMDPKTDLSQFHHCESCEGGTKKIVETTQELDEFFRIAKSKNISPRECMMVVLSSLCELAAAQENPDAAIEQASVTLKKLFESGREDDERRKKKPAFDPNVH